MRKVSALLVTVLVLVGGCARAGGSSIGGSAAASSGSGVRATGSPAPGAGASGTGGSAAPAGSPIGGASPATLAEADADRMMRALVVPAGAVRAMAYQGLNWAISTPGTDNLAHRESWWKVGGDPDAVLAAIEAAAPAGSSSDGRATTSEPDGVSHSVTFAWPPAGLLDLRWLEVGTARLGPYTIIRADAFVTYRAAKPVTAEIPSDVTSVTVAISYSAVPGGVGDNLHRNPPEPVVVTDPLRLAKAVALINAAPTIVPGKRNCPMSTGGAMRLAFRTAGVVAEVAIPTSGCAIMSVTAGGTSVDLDGGVDLVNQLIDVLGLPWPHA